MDLLPFDPAIFGNADDIRAHFSEYLETLRQSPKADFSNWLCPMINRIIVAGCDAAAKSLAVAGFKIFPAGDLAALHWDRDAETPRPIVPSSGWAQQKAFLAQTQAFGFHRSSGHFKSLAGTNFVCQQSVVAVQKREQWHCAGVPAD